MHWGMQELVLVSLIKLLVFTAINNNLFIYLSICDVLLLFI